MFIKEKVLDNIRIKSLMFQREEFEIYKTAFNDNLLIVKSSLYNKWIKDKLFFNVNPFKEVLVENRKYFYLKSDNDFILSLVELGGLVYSRQAALNFVFALKQMRQITSVSLYDGVFIEEFGYILPSYTQSVKTDDELLGYCFSGLHNNLFSDGNFKSLFLTDQDYDKIAKLVDIQYKKLEKVKPENKLLKYDTRFTLTGRPELEKFFNEHIINILNEPERYKKLGIDFPSSIILYGPPGCGKTYAVDKLVEFLKLPKYEINSASVASPYIHDTSKKVSAVFEDAINNAPSIVVIDEMESYLSNRDSYGQGSHHMEEVAEFLRQIQEANKNKVIVIAMTNMLDKIDPAILRKGRFDHHIEVGYPSVEEIESLLKFLFKDVSVSKEINVSDISSKLQGKTLADVSFIVKEAALISGKAGLDEICLDAINEALGILPQKQERRKIGFGED